MCALLESKLNRSEDVPPSRPSRPCGSLSPPMRLVRGRSIRAPRFSGPAALCASGGDGTRGSHGNMMIACLGHLWTAVPDEKTTQQQSIRTLTSAYGAPATHPLEEARTKAALRDHVMTILLFPVSLTPLEDTNITQLTLTATCSDHVFPPPSIIVVVVTMLQCAGARRRARRVPRGSSPRGPR